jgi:hypothetical protein
MVKYKVTASSLNIRSTASTSGAILGSESKGTILEIASDTKYNGSWLKLSKPYNGKTAYASSDYLSKIQTNSVADTDAVIQEYSAKGKIASSTLIYSSDSLTSKTGKYSNSLGVTLVKNSAINITKKSSNGFYYITSSNATGKAGWVPIANVLVENENGKYTSSVSKTSVEYLASNNSTTTFNDLLTDTSNISVDANNIGYASAQTAKELLVKNLNGIHGIPYQFMETVDRRLDSGNIIGRKYAERIVSKMPLLLMTPGSPDFLPTYNKNERIAILDTLINAVPKGTVVKGALDQILSTPGRYYTFKFNYSDYYGYVNSLLRMCSVYLNISDRVYTNGTKKSDYSCSLGSFRWEKIVNNELRGFINAQEYIAFYLDSETSISESFSTSTTTSKLADTVNSMSDVAKELQFLAGPIAGMRVEAFDDSNFEATMKDIQKISKEHLGNNRLFNNLAEQFATVGKGGKIAFPEIWEDTEFSKSYDISIKLRTPDADKLSWYLNICVPLIHLLGLAAPQQLGPNGYKSPFLVRAYYKGIFNCDMGIITSMSITKGKESAWTVDGLPTEVDVSISLKDLYSLLTITNADKTSVKNFLNNTCLMDYLANTCGININKPELTRTLETYVLLSKNKVTDTYGNNWLSIQNGLSNLANSAYKKFANQTN